MGQIKANGRRTAGKVCVLFGIGCLIAAVCFASNSVKNNPEKKKPENALLLSDMDLDEYVSLPVFEGITLEESAGQLDYMEVQRSVETALLEASGILDTVEGDCTIVATCAISQDDEYKETMNGYIIGVSSSGSTQNNLSKLLNGLHVGESVRYEPENEFEGYTGAEVYITIKGIYNIPYPVTDKYMEAHTEYSSFQDMVDSTYNSSASTERTRARKETMDNLIDTLVARTTFQTFPESLCNEETEVLKKEGRDPEYQDAVSSLKRIFFLASVIEKNGIANTNDLAARVQQYEEESGIILEGYEKDRMQFLLYEEDVKNFVYKNITIESEVQVQAENEEAAS